ncbi:MAG: PAC2 family protein [Thermoproteota archaeon]
MSEKHYLRIYVKDMPLMETKVWFKKGVEIVNPVVIVGLPGLGRIGRIISRYLIRKLNARLAGIITSPYFSNQVVISSSGISRITALKIYVSKQFFNGSSLLTVTADEHLENIWGEYEVAMKLLKFLTKRNVKLIVTVGGHVSTSEFKKTICFASNKKLLERLENAGCKRAETGTPVVGLSGIILGISSIMGLDAACILGETTGIRPDVEGARETLKALINFLNLDLDMEDFSREEVKINEMLSRYEKKVRQMMQDERARKIAEAFRPPDYVS